LFQHVPQITLLLMQNVVNIANLTNMHVQQNITTRATVNQLGPDLIRDTLSVLGLNIEPNLLDVLDH